MDVFLLRKPIFDSRQNVFAYEVPCRTHRPSSAKSPSDAAPPTENAADALLHYGLERITRGKKAFIRYRADAFIAGYEAQLPAALVVIEFLDEFDLTAAFIESCRRLKNTGFQLAAGEFALKLKNAHPLLDLIDFIKVDFTTRETADSKIPSDRMASLGIKLIAHGLDTREDFQRALNSGFNYFQGSFFSKAVMTPGKDIPSYKLNHLRVLHELNRSDLDFGALEEVIRRDAALSYKLLTCVNSVFFGIRTTVTSIRHALALLGEREIRKWASLVILRDLTQDKPAELLVTSLVRANFCGSLAPLVGLRDRAQELFLMGLLSLLDVMVGRPMREVMQTMPLGETLQTALLGGHNPYADVLNLVLSYEKGDLERFVAQANALQIDEGLVTDLYLRSTDFAEKAMQLDGPRTGSERS